MREPLSANAWRAAALALAAGWVVMACGGGGGAGVGDGVPVEAPAALVTTPVISVATAASQVTAAQPCLSPARQAA
ncbi:MAG TPA: hypothetical protein VHQ87_14280, partial [Rhizobacter sp.]|nr:hypothetical protein [Rhizobacter sp.]